MELIKQTKAHSTKTLVELWDMGKETNEDGGRWQTVCVDHGNCMNHDKKSNAVYFLSHPEEWCEDCN